MHDSQHIDHALQGQLLGLVRCVLVAVLCDLLEDLQGRVLVKVTLALGLLLVARRAADDNAFLLWLLAAPREHA